MANPGERVSDVALTEDRLIVDLADGRTVSVLLAWFPKLLHATSQERDNWEIAGAPEFRQVSPYEQTPVSPGLPLQPKTKPEPGLRREEACMTVAILLPWAWTWTWA